MGRRALCYAWTRTSTAGPGCSQNANRKRRANVAGRKGQEEGGESRGQVSRNTGRFVQDRRCHETIASAYHSREGKKGGLVRRPFLLIMRTLSERRRF